MKAMYARVLADAANKCSKGIREIDRIIGRECRAGKFSTKIPVCWDWGHASDLEDHYQSEGYTVHITSAQTDPNSSDTFIRLDWQEN